MPKKINIMLFEDETRWQNLFEKLINDIKREKGSKYQITYSYAATLDEAKRTYSDTKPDIVVSDVYIETKRLSRKIVQKTDNFVAAMTELCKDEGEIDTTSLTTLRELHETGYRMDAHYRREGLMLLDFVRNSSSPDILFIIWSSKLFCMATNLKDVARMKRGPDLILPKPPIGQDDPDLRDRLRQTIDVIGSGVWEKVKKLIPWIRPIILGG